MSRWRKALAGAAIPVYMLAALSSSVTAESNSIFKANNFNLRQSPSSISKVPALLHLNDQVTIMDDSDGQYDITWNGYDGWLYGQYIQQQTDSNIKVQQTVQQSAPTIYDTINSDSVNLRSGPGTSYDIAKRLNAGEKVAILSNSNGWANVKLSDNSTGWVSAQYLGEKSTIATEQKSNSEKYGTIYSDSVNVRSGAGTNYDVVVRQYYGDKVTILSNSNGWYNVQLADGKTGWIIERYVSIGNSRALEASAEVLGNARKYLGTKYVYGGTSPNGFDCSGFVQYVYNKCGVSLLRVAADQATEGVKVSKSDLQRGDLVFFDTDGGHNYINHVGIYIGDGEFMHASSGSGKVITSDISSGYYANAYMTARRVLR